MSMVIVGNDVLLCIESVSLWPQVLIDSLSMHCHVTDIFVIVAIVVIVDMLMIIGAYNHWHADDGGDGAW